MQYRTRIEIAAAILKTANGGARRLDVIYKANLSSVTGREYLDYLLERQLLERNYDGPDYYRTTAKGFEFLRWYDAIADLFPIELDAR